MSTRLAKISTRHAKIMEKEKKQILNFFLYKLTLNLSLVNNYAQVSPQR